MTGTLGIDPLSFFLGWGAGLALTLFVVAVIAWRERGCPGTWWTD